MLLRPQGPICGLGQLSAIAGHGRRSPRFPVRVLSRQLHQHQRPRQHPHQQRRHLGSSDNSAPLDDEPSHSNARPLSSTPQGTLMWQGEQRPRYCPPPFEISSLVMDLDAEDSPHVRPFDIHNDGKEQVSKWGYDPAVDEAARFVADLKSVMKADAKKMFAARRVGWFALDKTHISDHEVLMVVLLGGNNVAEGLRDKNSSNFFYTKDAFVRRSLLRTFHEYGVPATILQQGSSKVVPFMLQRQAHSEVALGALVQKELEAVQELERSELPSPDPVPRDEEAQTYHYRSNIQSQLFAKHVKRCKFPYELRKMCTLLHSPKSLSLNVDVDALDAVTMHLIVMLDYCKDKVRARKNSLTLVNNMTLKRIAANRPLSALMTVFGMHMASSLGVLPAILQYADMCIMLGAIGPSSPGVRPICAVVASAILAALERGEGTARGTRPLVFTLVTGTVHSSAEPPQGSILGLEAEGPGSQPGNNDLRTKLYGELGALRMLWHHWAARKRNGAPRIDYNNMYVQAFLRCAQLLGNISKSSPSIDTTTCTGDIHQDAQLDWLMVDAMEASYVARRKKMPKLSSLVNVKQRIEAEEILKALNQRTIFDAMQHFQTLIERVAGSQKALEEEAESDEPVGEQEDLTDNDLPPVETGTSPDSETLVDVTENEQPSRHNTLHEDEGKGEGPSS